MRLRTRNGVPEVAPPDRVALFAAKWRTAQALQTEDGHIEPVTFQAQLNEYGFQIHGLVSFSKSREALTAPPTGVVARQGPAATPIVPLSNGWD
jgi:hypothetical protein